MEGDREAILAEEWLLVRHSGELPEVALHGGLFYLGEDAQGPRLVLTREEIACLQQAALARYQEIILRDLDTANRDRSLFRGIRRAHHNWYRLVRFCDKFQHDADGFRTLAAKALLSYLEMEQGEVCSGARAPSINCTAEAVRTFALALGVEPSSLPEGWKQLCEQSDT